MSNFWISTGGISEPYETLNIVFGSGSVARPAFGDCDTNRALKLAIDMMATQAEKMGGNGLIWIRFERVTESLAGVSVFASGTAVKVTT